MMRGCNTLKQIQPCLAWYKQFKHVAFQEQRTILSSEDVGEDEDSAESLIKKNKALMQDVEQFAEVVTDLHKQAEECKVIKFFM